jgi:hypothetical protein
MKITVLNQEIKRFKNQTVAFLEVALTNNNTIIDKTEVKGIARCCPEDKYNFNVGRKIALARAEIKAYKYFKPYLSNIAELYKVISEKSSLMVNKLENQIAHNKEYIKDIISGSIEIDAGNTKL